MLRPRLGSKRLVELEREFDLRMQYLDHEYTLRMLALFREFEGKLAILATTHDAPHAPREDRGALLVAQVEGGS